MRATRGLCGVLALCLLSGARGTPAQPVSSDQAPTPVAAEPPPAAPASAPSDLRPAEQPFAAPALTALQAATLTMAGPMQASLEAAEPSSTAPGLALASVPATEDQHLYPELVLASKATALHNWAASASAPTQAPHIRPSANDPACVCQVNCMISRQRCVAAASLCPASCRRLSKYFNPRRSQVTFTGLG